MSAPQAVRRFLERRGWVEGLSSVEFLAAGEYNENFLVRGAGGDFVLRVNHDSQLGLEDQIGYEFRALRAVAPSGVTPEPLFCDPRADGLGRGVLLMRFIPGDTFIYPRDRDKAAAVFAAVHALPPGEGLIVQRDPVQDIARESYGLLTRYPDHPLRKHRERLLAYHERIVELGEKSRGVFAEERLCIVNTEVNSGNFLVDPSDGRAFLVDWEKAVVSYRYQDLGHFLVPTTTLWKSDYVYSAEEKLRFLATYRKLLSLEVELKELYERTRLLERTILLRALSWCYMAYFEYTGKERSLKNRDTFEKIRSYLNDVDCFLD
jgi:aminoglycoside phosphotransferase (APT) family kinase protein